MVKTEMRWVFRNPLVIVVLIAIAFIPTIYAGLFLNSMWDPYGELEYLPVAVVNNDKAYTYKEKELTVGKDLAEELEDNDSMSFNLVDADTAEKGLKNGTYYMVITIPDNFSKCASTVMDDKPEQMVLDYATNPGRNYIAMKMGQSAIKEIKASLIEQVTKTYTETVFDSIVEVADGFDEATDGTDEMLKGEKKLVKGNKKISKNLKKLADSSLTFRDGADTLAEGLKTYTDGVAKLDEGMNTLNEGVGKLSSSAVGGSKKLYTGSKTLKNGVKTYTDGVSTAQKGSAQLVANNNALNNGMATLSTGVGSLKTGSEQLLLGLTTIQSSLDTALTTENVTKMKLAAESLPKLNEGIQQLNTAVNGSGKSDVDTSSITGALTSVGGDLTKAGGYLKSEDTSKVTVSSATTALSVNLYGPKVDGSGGVAANLVKAGAALDATDSTADAAGALEQAINVQVEQLTKDLTAYAGGDSAALADITQEVKTLNYLYGTENLTKVLKAKGAYDAVNPILSKLDKSEGVAGYLGTAGSELKSAATTMTGDAKTNLTGIGTAATNVGASVQSAGNTLTALSKSDFASQMTQLSTGIQTLASSSEQLCGPSSQALSSLLGGMQGIQTAFNNTAAKNGSSGVIEGMTALNAGIGTVQTGIDSESGLKAGIKTYTSGVQTLDAGLKKIKSNNKALNNGMTTLSSGCKTLYTGLDAGIPTLTSGVGKLLDGSGQLVANNNKLNKGVNKLADGAEKISDGSGKLYDGSKKVTDGLVTLKDGTTELHDALSDGADEVRDNEATDANIDMFVNPVETEETQITTVQNNGHAMAAYMLTVGLWVGCLAFCLMYPLAIYHGEFENGRKWWLSKAFVLYPLSILQALIVLLVLKLALGFEPENWLLTIGVAIATSQAFMAIMYFFNVFMGKVGSFLMLIFMVLQLAGSAGTYPVELSGSMVAKIHKYVPFTYTVDAFRSAISGGEPVTKELFVLTFILVLFTGLTIIMFWYRGMRIKKGKPTIYDFIEEHGMA